jgi:glycosyltransferase involved in cell wall biosynthesis
MKIICIGNYVPRKCGIATFTENLVKAILKAAEIDHQSIEMEVIAMNDHGQIYDYPTPVKKSISDSNKDEYIEMADYINDSGASICLLQHEYGIFGGDSGLFILALIRKLKIPLVTTSHTVLKKPAFHQREVMKKICEYSSRIVVMSNLARNIFHTIYNVPLEKISLIGHGVPDFTSKDLMLPAKPVLWANRTVILTFGLIGRNKGIETVIRALPAIAAKHPEVLYVVLGKTHPNVVRHVGEEYREFLTKLTAQLEVSQNISFMDEYVDETRLMSLLRAADLYVTPYLNKAQITSGSLCYAVAGGCAVISTPYWHAQELLSDERGLLFEFENHIELADLVNRLIENPDQRTTLQSNAFEYGKTITWPKIGKSYLDLFQVVAAQTDVNPESIALDFKTNYPGFDLSHIVKLTDDTGLLQHANACVPCYKTGYCLDDNSRGLIVCLRAWKNDPSTRYESLIIKYLSYIGFMSRKDGSFNNFLTYDRSAFEDDISDDAFGRTIWALGYLVRHAPNDSLFQAGIQLFNHSIHYLHHLRYLRGYANCIFGLYHYLKRFPDQDQYLVMMVKLADQLCASYHAYHSSSWNWFEETVTYDNGLLPAALFKAYKLTHNPDYLFVAGETSMFLESKCLNNNWLSLIGNHKWLRLDGEYDSFAQQPIDALAMMIMYESAWSATNNPSAIQKLLRSYDWFFGRNDLNLPVYDAETKGCNDGIEEFNINRNQGAESTIAYLWSNQIAQRFR